MESGPNSIAPLVTQLIETGSTAAHRAPPAEPAIAASQHRSIAVQATQMDCFRSHLTDSELIRWQPLG